MPESVGQISGITLGFWLLIPINQGEIDSLSRYNFTNGIGYFCNGTLQGRK
jgi:hypothetical protein